MSRPGIDCAEALLILHFDAGVARGAHLRETRFVLKEYPEEQRYTLSFWGREFALPEKWEAYEPRLAVNAFVEASLEWHGLTDLLREWQPMGEIHA